MTDPKRQAEVQRRYFEEADPERFHWAVSGAGFAETEDELLAPLLAAVQDPCLELGCGEGNNLARLLSRAPCVGVDLFTKKLSFAAREVPQARLVTADASALPFFDGAFATVFIRDLLHHVPNPEATLSEAVRVLRPGGSLCLLEPNGRNPLIQLQTRLVPAEAGARRFGADLIAGWLAAQPLVDVRIAASQPFPLRRLVLHYRFGLPSLGRYRLARQLLKAIEALLGKLLPYSRWSCVTAIARRRIPD